MTWQLKAECVECGYIGATALVTLEGHYSLEMLRQCPRCRDKQKAPVGAFKQWRAVRKFRSELRRTRFTRLS